MRPRLLLPISSDGGAAVPSRLLLPYYRSARSLPTWLLLWFWTHSGGAMCRGRLLPRRHRHRPCVSSGALLPDSCGALSMPARAVLPGRLCSRSGMPSRIPVRGSLESHTLSRGKLMSGGMATAGACGRCIPYMRGGDEWVAVLLGQRRGRASRAWRHCGPRHSRACHPSRCKWGHRPRSSVVDCSWPGPHVCSNRGRKALLFWGQLLWATRTVWGW